MAGRRWEKDRSVLLIGLSPAALATVRETLAPLQLSLTAAPDGISALNLAPFKRFDALLMSYPLADLPISTFLDAVRKKNSPWLAAAVILLAPESARPEAGSYVGRGVNRVVGQDEVDRGLAAALERLLQVAPRLPIKALGRVEVLEGSLATRLLCQTGNLSSSGMFLRTQHRLYPSTELAFELYLPGDLEPVRGHARVVRTAQPCREVLAGIGVTFSGFERGHSERLVCHLQRQLP